MLDSALAKIEKVPPTTTSCLRLFRKLVIQSKILWLMPSASQYGSYYWFLYNDNDNGNSLF